MEIINLSDVLENRETTMYVIERIRSGMVFVYPTDTVYGLGCNALNRESVLRIRRMKKTDHPFSVIAPSLEWVEKNFVIRFPEYLRRLPGPVTLLLEQKVRIIPEETSGSCKVGIRIPNHPFTHIIQEAGVPFVTTSANISGEKTITKISELPQELRKVDIVIDGGILDNPPSEIWDLTGERPERVR